MTTSGRWSWRRIATMGAAVGLILAAAGDRGARSDVPGGIDPLDILNLQIRANAIIILDSSGSMMNSLFDNSLAGDDSNSKLFLAKQTLKTVLRQNQRKVSFQFGQYEQPGVTPATAVMTVPQTGIERFMYTTTSAKASSMLTNQLVVDLRSFLIPTGTRVEFTEGTTNRTSPDIPAMRYPTALALAAAVQNAMNATVGRVNSYTVTFDDARRFVFTRATGTANLTLRWGNMGTLQTRMHPGSTASQGPGTGPFTTNVQPNDCTSGGTCDLKRRNTGNTVYTETDSAGVSTTTYKMYARRFFNGQRLLVRPSGVVCSVTGFTAAGLPQQGIGGTGAFNVDTSVPPDGIPDDYDRPWIELQRADASCNVVTGANAQVVQFTFSSVPRGGNSGTPANNGADDAFYPGYGEWRTWNTNSTCGGFRSLLDLQPCTQNAQFNLVAPFLENEIPIDPTTHFPTAYVEAEDGTITTQQQVGGMRAAGNTPIAESIADVDTVFTGSLWPQISIYGGGSGPFPKTFLIFLTDGDDTCESTTGGSTLSSDQLAMRAAYRAQLLYQSVDTTNPARTQASSVPTFVIAFGRGASADRADWIAWGGSGMTRGTTGSGGLIRWSPWGAAPDDADSRRAACTICRDAFIATDTAELAKALQIAIDQGQTGGTFSDQQSVTESIFELSYLVPQGTQPEPFDPRNPQTRYDTTLPVLLQSTFDMPDFNGHLKAFRNNGGTSLQVWDAGQKLYDRVVTNGISTSAVNPTFDELRGGTATTDVTIGASSALIKRRIYTTTRNGWFGVTVDNHIDGVSPSRTTLWPPSPAVDPVGGTGNWPTGALDDKLGIGPASIIPTGFTGAGSVVTFNYLSTRFGACTASVTADVHADCTSATASIQLARARKEARQIILAHQAGADLQKVGGLGVRRTANKELTYRARAWILAESTLSAPAVAGAPTQTPPSIHLSEYTLYRDGPRIATGPTTGQATDALSMGFGLRNPDDDTASRTDTAPGMDSRNDLKPVMTVAYHAANDMLHAFRAGPCRDNSAAPNCRDGRQETGGEELWGFVPFDMLGQIKDRMGSQRREPHTYVLAAPVRLADIFVPGPFSRNVGGAPVSGDGVWRTVIFFGRGIGGKYLTALDVTAPGPYTFSSLQAAGPIVLWNRGNPDTQNGLVGGPANNTVATNTDVASYARMGETWSIPAIAPVKAAVNTTPRKPLVGSEFVAYAGSGYGDTSGCASGSSPCEGKRFFALDALTGDVIYTYDTTDRPGTNVFENAIVAGPAAFNGERLKFQSAAAEINTAQDLTSRVYFVDIHGRLYVMKEPTVTNPTRTFTQLADVNNATTVEQPLAVGPSLLNTSDPTGVVAGNRPHIYLESGHDKRIFPPDADPATTPPFKLFGLRDDDLLADPSSTDQVVGPIKVLFVKPLPNLYRGNVQAATAFTADGLGRVFFAGSRFNPPGTTFAPPPPPCRSSFDSILFAVGASSGNAAYDLNASGQDEYIEYQNQKVQAVQVKGGILVVDRGLGAEVPPPPPAPPELLVPPTSGNVYVGLSTKNSCSNCITSHQTMPFNSGTSVCR